MVDRFRVAIADADRNICQAIAVEMNRDPHLELVDLAHDGVAALSVCRQWSPDLLLLDLVLPGLDGLAVLAQMRDWPQRPRVVVFTELSQERWMRRALAHGVNYYIAKPFDINILVQRLRQVCAPGTVSVQFRCEQRRQRIASVAARCIAELGVPRHFKGHAYLCDAIAMVVQDAGLLKGVTGLLYPQVASLHGTSATQVERAIRNAIEATWTRGDIERIHALFAHSVDKEKGKPTNSSFIARLADHVLLRVRAS